MVVLLRLSKAPAVVVGDSCAGLYLDVWIKFFILRDYSLVFLVVSLLPISIRS
jgi:hypothetical protein